MGESLGVESENGVGYSFGFSGRWVERKFESSSGVSERVASEARVEMVSGITALGADAVEVEVTTARASIVRSRMRCSWENVEEILLIWLDGGPV